MGAGLVVLGIVVPFLLQAPVLVVPSVVRVVLQFHWPYLILTFSGLAGGPWAVLVSGRASRVPAVVSKVMTVEAFAFAVADARNCMFLWAAVVVFFRGVCSAALVALYRVLA